MNATRNAKSFDLEIDDCAVIIRGDGGIEAIVPDQVDDQIVHDASLIVMALNFAVDRHGLDVLARKLVDEYMEMPLQ